MFGGKGDGGRTGDRVGAFGHVGVVTSERRADMLGRRTGQDMVPVAALPPSSSTTASTASTASRPRLRPHVVIVVEGINDARNVRRYLDVDIYVLGSATKTGTSATQEELRGLQSRYRRIVLLLDPDVAGRQARNDIDRLLGGDKVRCWMIRFFCGWLGCGMGAHCWVFSWCDCSAGTRLFQRFARRWVEKPGIRGLGMLVWNMRAGRPCGRRFEGLVPVVVETLARGWAVDCRSIGGC